jgi:hypothetical protein
MTGVPLRLGPLQANGFIVHRSGVHWLCEDGHVCRPNEVIGYCNVSVEPASGHWPAQTPFAEERELQVAFAPRVGGRLRIAEGVSLGGHLDEFGVHDWDADTVVGRFETMEGRPAAASEVPETLRLLMLAGRRMTGLADVLTGLLPGWHNRARGWWGDDAAEPATLLSMGICDAIGPVRGDQSAFLEMFEAAAFPAHVVFVPNNPVAPCATCLFEQFTRTPASFQAIASDIVAAVSGGSIKPTSDDWLFVGALLVALDRSPMRDTYDLLTPTGLRKGGSPTSILISLTAEGTSILRHKKLGYHLHILPVYRAAAGPAVKAWLTSAFEPVKRSTDDMRRDYVRLFDTVRAETNARFLILNRMSTSGREDISTYAPFDPPMGEALANIASKELNLMLHDIAQDRDISIIDVDEIAADLGGSSHLPDGIHQSGTMQAELRAEILHALATGAVS